MNRPPVPFRTLPVLATALALLGSGAGAEEPAAQRGAPAVVAHEVRATLDPATGGIEVVDRMAVRRNGGGNLRFTLREGLEIRSLEADGRDLDALVREPEGAPPGMALYRVPVHPVPGEARITVGYGGVIREEVRKADDLAFVVGDRSRGTISPEGVFLSESTGWVPATGDMATYAVTATVPAGWQVVTQGGVQEHLVEEDPATDSFLFDPGIPCDGLWLQAGRWTVERRTTKEGVSIATYLSAANAGVSKVMLDAVEEYLALYRKVLGPYPHAKFDIVENFFTSGYGMPGATLLGGDVITHIDRMARHSGGKVPAGYLDHELVHCWWGNGVFVDYGKGNWCEALTTYCSNYLRKEWESEEEAARHRRGVRARFAARVSPGRDYPLREFTGKTEDFENDIGYGKGSMVFHALRRAVGDGAFFGALRDLVRDFTGKRASWDDIRRALEKRSGRNLEAAFRQYLDRTGAPVPVLDGVAAAPGGDGWTVSGRVLQQGRPWEMPLPLVVETVRGRVEVTVEVAAAATPFSVRTESLPVRVLLDPDSHAWRGFAEGEVPATLDAALHDPAGRECWAPAGEAGAPFAPVVERLRERAARVCETAQGGFDPKPAPPGTVSVLALGNLATDLGLRALLDEVRPGVSVSGATLTVAGQRFEGEDVALLASVRHPADPSRFATVYAGMSPAALSGARRVFFYGGDGIVVFRSGRPVLRLEAEGEESSRAPLLEGLLPGASTARIQALVEALCARPVEGRLAGTPAGKAAADLLAAALAGEDGLTVLRQPVSFEVPVWDGTPCVEGPQPGSRPFCFSAPAPEPIPVDPRGQVFLAGPESTPEDLLLAVREAVDRGATGVLVIGPPDPPAALAPYLLEPPPAADGGGGAPRPDPDLATAARLSRLVLPPFGVPVPVVYYPKPPEASALPGSLRATVARRTVETENLLALLPGSDPALAGEAVLLGAHHDHLGPGFPGADDDASGCAAVREAARLLAARRSLLRRPVVIALFGAEEWGLRGSARFAADPPDGFPRVVAALNLDTVGRAGVEAVSVVGESIYPDLAACVARCLRGAGLSKGRDIDRFAFAWGSDHYALHAAGIPAVDLFAGDYRTMHTPGDAPGYLDTAKIARLARAAAAFALETSRAGAPR